MSSQTSIPTHGGDRADVRHLERTKNGSRVKVSHGDREWICVVNAHSGEVNVEIGRRDGSPADLKTPDWLRQNLAQLGTPA